MPEEKKSYWTVFEENDVKVKIWPILAFQAPIWGP